MKKWFIVLALAAVVGCTYGEDRLGDLLDDPTSLLKDPHYAEHLKKTNEVERQYLHKEISYAQYVEEKKRLEDKYTKEVQAREEIIIDKY